MSEDTARVHRVVEQEISDKIAPAINRKLKIYGAIGTLLGLGFGAAMFLFMHFASASKVEKLETRVVLHEQDASDKALRAFSAIATLQSDVATTKDAATKTEKKVDRLEDKVDQVLLQLGGVKRTVQRLGKE